MNCFLPWNLKDMLNISADKLQRNIGQQTSYIELYRSELLKESLRFNVASLLRHVILNKSSFVTDDLSRRATDCLIVFLHSASFLKKAYFAPTDAENPAVGKCARNLHRLMLENVKTTMKYMDYNLLLDIARGRILESEMYEKREAIHQQIFPDADIPTPFKDDAIGSEFLKLAEIESSKAREFSDFDVQKHSDLPTDICQMLSSATRRDDQIPESRFGIIGSCRSYLETPFIRYGNTYYGFVVPYSLSRIAMKIQGIEPVQIEKVHEPEEEEPVVAEEPKSEPDNFPGIVLSYSEPQPEKEAETEPTEEEVPEIVLDYNKSESEPGQEPVDEEEPIPEIVPEDEPAQEDEEPVPEIVPETEEEPEPEPVEEPEPEPVEEPEQEEPDAEIVPESEDEPDVFEEPMDEKEPEPEIIPEDEPIEEEEESVPEIIPETEEESEPEPEEEEPVPEIVPETEEESEPEPVAEPEPEPKAEEPIPEYLPDLNINSPFDEDDEIEEDSGENETMSEGDSAYTETDEYEFPDEFEEDSSNSQETEEEQGDDVYEDSEDTPDENVQPINPTEESYYDEEPYTALVSPDTYEYLDEAQPSEFTPDPMLDEQESISDAYDEYEEEPSGEEDAEDEEPEPYSSDSLFDMIDDSEEDDSSENNAEDSLPDYQPDKAQKESFPSFDDDEEPEPAKEPEQEPVPEIVNEPVVEPEVEPQPEPQSASLPLLDQILSFSPSRNNAITQYLTGCTFDQQREIVRVIELARKAWLIDSKDKMFTIPDTSISVAVFAETQDPMVIIQRRENIGAVMYASQKDIWNSLELSYDASGQFSKAEFVRLSRSSFSDWEWKIVEKIGNRLIERRSK